jgi:hypothetical protein
MEERINLLLNQALQKFLKLARCARENQATGKEDEDDFCYLTRLEAVIYALENGELTYDQLRALEKIINQIGGRDDFQYRPTVQTPSIQPAQKNCCDSIDDILNQLKELRDLLNYDPPTLLLESLGIMPGKYEVGYGDVQTDIRWLANKKPLTTILIDLWPDADFSTVNLSGVIYNVNLPLASVIPLNINIYGFYHDQQPFKGQHLIAEAYLKFQTVWPCYWGKGPGNALDNPANQNSFILSLTRELDCAKCIEANLEQGEYLWYFFPFTGMAKQFWTENGAISGSYKGTIDGVKTQSMVTNGINGGAEYGVIRFDETGIGQLIVCIKDMPYPEVIIQEPVVVVPEIIIPVVPEVVTYAGTWNELYCVQVEN